MYKHLMTTAIFACLLSGPALGQAASHNTTSVMLPLCKAALNPRNNVNLYRQGECVGVLKAIVFTDLKICEPDQWSNNQVLQIFVNYAERHPERWSETYVILASSALRAAWPCAGDTSDVSTPTPRSRTTPAPIPNAGGRIRAY